jgi:transposase InsO family protein
VRALIQRLATDNAGWGAPRIHGELLKLGFTVAQSTVAAWMPKRPRPEKPRSQRWRTFLKNHLAQAVAMDFFVIPTATFQLLYGFVVLQHNRRRIRHVAVTAHPTAEWTAQQLREAFPCDSAPRFLHRDRDGIYGDAVTTTIEAMGIEEVLSAPRSPWQNPYCERVIGTLRRELLNNVIVLGESHARRLLKENVEYCNGSRTHLSLEKDAPEPRAIEPPSAGPVQAREGLGGLHHPLLPPRGVVGLSQLEVRPPRSTCVLGASRANSTSSSAWRSSRTRRASYSALPVTGRTHRDGDVRTLLRTADRQVAFEVFGRHNGDRRTRTAVQVAQVMNRA